MKVKQITLREEDSQQAAYTVKSSNPTTGEITVAPSVAPAEIKPGSTINLDAPDQAMGEDEKSLDRYNGEHDPDIDDTTARQVRRMAHELENRWGSYEDWGQEELESIASELQISTEEVADALGLDSSQYSPDDAEIWEDDIAQVGQPEDDQQMEAIKRLAGL